MPKIAVIDDDEGMQEFVVRALSHYIADCEVLSAFKGTEGIEIVKRCQPSAILLDINMPGIDGFTVCQNLKSNPETRSIPIIMSTGADVTMPMRVKALEIGADAFLAKPLVLAELIAQVKAALRIKNAEDALRRKNDELEELVQQRTRQLAESETRYRSLFQSATVAIFLIQDGHFFDCNPKTLELFGCTREQLIGKRTHLFSPEQQPDGLYSLAKEQEKLEQAQDGQKLNFEWQYQRFDKTIFDAEVNFSPIVLSHERYVLAIVRDVTAKKRAQEALHANLLFQETLLDTISSPVFYKDSNDIFRVCNTAFANEFFGLKKEQIIGRTLQKLSAESPNHHHFKDFELMKNGGRQLDEIQVTAKDGENRNYFVSRAAFDDASGQPAGIVGFLVDISQRKQMETELIKQKELFLNIINNIPYYVYWKDRQSVFLGCNRHFAQLFNFNDPHELVGKTNYDLSIDAEVADAVRRTDQRIMESGAPLLDSEETYHIGKDRSVILSISKVPLRDQVGNVIGILGIDADITERKRAEEELKKLHQQNEHLLASIESILIAVDFNERITLWNRVAEKTFNMKSGDILGKNLLECKIEWDWINITQHILTSRSENRPIFLNDVRFKRADGRDGFLNLSISPSYSNNSGSRGFLFLGDDVTERKIMESQLSQAQKLESIGQLAAGIAHEINTPTQYVGDNIQFLKEAFTDLNGLITRQQKALEEAASGASSNEIIQDALKQAEIVEVDYLLDEIPLAINQSLDGVKRISKIVRAMKEFSHPGSDEKTLVDLNRALENTITVAKNEWKYVADLITDFDESLPAVPCLPNELNQVFLNMIINAVHAISEHPGHREDQKGTITIRTAQNNGFAEIHISDSGTGVPEAIRSKIFDPFFTTKEVGKGTGQGLAISHDIIYNKHQGTIQVESEVGKGATFIIRLPLN